MNFENKHFDFSKFRKSNKLEANRHLRQIGNSKSIKVSQNFFFKFEHMALIQRFKIGKIAKIGINILMIL